MKRYKKLLVTFGATLGFLFCTGLLLDFLFPIPLKRVQDLSKEVRMENQQLIHTFLTSDEKWRLKTTVKDVHPLYVNILIAKEDRWFWVHWGINPLSLARAFKQWMNHGKVISGGSTLTMQVARLLEPKSRTLWHKSLEILRAFQLEWHYSKKEILEIYLTLAPFGGNLEGVRAASHSFFGKTPFHLTPSEVALLVILPQSPKRWQRTHFLPSTQEKRDQVLHFAYDKKFLSKPLYQIALKDPLPQSYTKMPRHAHHLARRLTYAPSAPLISTCTLKQDIQDKVQHIARQILPSLPQGANLAILIAHAPSSKVVGYIGSGDFFDEERKGQIDYITAIRSPGSTLKPFIYGLGFDLGFIQPDSYLLNDRLRFGDYAPHNFDKTFSGIVTVREALQNSLNIPAVSLLNQIGTRRLLGLFEEANIYPHFPEKDTLEGLSISLGGLGLTLEDLVSLYQILAQEGVSSPLTLTSSPSPPERTQIFSPQSAAWLRSILILPSPAVQQTEDNKIALKTGTSYGHRDALAVGYNRNYVVGVWVGHPKCRPLGLATGESLAVPILLSVFKALPCPKESSAPRALAPKPSALRLYKPWAITYHMTRLQEKHLQTPRILFPVDNTVLEHIGSSPIILKVAHGKPPYTWIINQKVAFTNVSHLQVSWTPPSPGFYEIVVLDQNGHAETVHIEIKDEPH